jgi:polysaccharide deacetylase 2 family uncharacterized protein YibQ
VKKSKGFFRFKGFWAVFFLLILSVPLSFIVRDLHKGHLREGAGGLQHPESWMEKESLKNRPTAEEKRRPAGKSRRVAIIVDDIGYDLSHVDELLRIDVPLTFSILPHCTHSLEAAKRIHRAGREILLHLPMEPQDYPEKNPGKGVLLTHMTGEELKDVLDEDLLAVPHAVGVNNHMGSRFMEDGEKLAAVFRILKDRGVFFVDSLTTGRSRGRDLAGDFALSFIARDLFIDTNGDSGETPAAFMRLLKAYRHRRQLVVIGHPYPGTISAIRESVRYFRQEGIEVVPVSALFKN